MGLEDSLHPTIYRLYDATMFLLSNGERKLWLTFTTWGRMVGARKYPLTLSFKNGFLLNSFSLMAYRFTSQYSES